MPRKNPAVDACLVAAPQFARPILKRLRKLFHQACPKLEERIRWGMPNFDYCGPLAMITSHKAHVNLVFFRAPLLTDPEGLFRDVGRMAALRFHAVQELPADGILVAYIREAALINEQGKKLPAPKKRQRPPVKTPADLAAQLRKHPATQAKYAALSPSHQREYIDWITAAKREETRLRRLAKAMEWLAQGKSRNWKYERKKT